MVPTKQLGNYIISSDCMLAIKATTENRIVRNNVTCIASICRELLQSQLNASIKLMYEGRGANKLTDSIAKLAKERVLDVNKF